MTLTTFEISNTEIDETIAELENIFANFTVSDGVWNHWVAK